MQTFTANDCNALPINGITALTDTRDNKVYNIIKLKMSSNGTGDKCWMQQNLALENKTLTPTDSNVNSNFTLGAVQTTAPANNYNITNPAYRPDSTCKDGTGTTIACSSAGYLYNWATAIAYSTSHYGTGANNTSQDLSTNGTIAQYSICPKGWRLPVGGAYTSGSTTGNEFALVDVNAYGGTGANRTDANALAKWTNASGFAADYAGNFLGGSFSGQGSITQFWSSSVSSGTNAYYLGLNSVNGFVNPQNSNVKNYGFSVRCVFGS
jgi:uncharacterized protein (TIGR02145 family)